ncbi:hypothetical protein HYS31_04690 [Candidatus Woesearchaeota archaeon]|nr:hypothetical protein [Candidatus Woesearchaeota archaeon]
MGQITSRIGKFNNLYGNFGESLASNFLLFGDAIKSNFGNVAFEDVRDRLKNLSYGLSELRNLSPFTGPAMNLLKQWVFTPLADGFKGLILMLKEGFQEMFTKFEESFSRIKSSNFPSFQMGTSFVPRDTLAYLHRGESVIPAGESQTINFSSPNIYITGTGLDAREIADKIKAFLNDTWARELGSLARR